MWFRSLKVKKLKTSTTHHSQQCNLLNNQQLYQPQTCPSSIFKNFFGKSGVDYSPFLHLTANNLQEMPFSTI